MLKVYSKIHKFSEVISYFCTREITFCNRRTRHLWDTTSQLDRQVTKQYQNPEAARTLLLQGNLSNCSNRRTIVRCNVCVFVCQLFPFSMAEVDWDEYFDDYLLGIRRYLFKQTDDSLPRARIKWKRYRNLSPCIFIFVDISSPN
ncbi:hypothetical protein RR48_06507 [Papilio machaon]|uniref:Uncharacterized protein n=1 Tax=Papilio machaon TaxID=76193 RepID=A0A194RQ80_PAPMA|nr:hypothetical protein RR48_06507 [Papilio machaon]